jgi:hypothetical protein
VRQTDDQEIAENFTMGGIIPTQIVLTSKHSHLLKNSIGGIILMGKVASKGVDTMLFLILGNFLLQILL